MPDTICHHTNDNWIIFFMKYLHALQYRGSYRNINLLLTAMIQINLSLAQYHLHLHGQFILFLCIFVIIL